MPEIISTCGKGRNANDKRWKFKGLALHESLCKECQKIAAENGGWFALCGDSLPSPWIKAVHQSKCRKCREILGDRLWYFVRMKPNK